MLAQQFPSDLWHPGLLVTNDGDTIKGDLKYDFENQSIQLDDGQTLKAYNVNNLFFFEIYDETIKDYRQFYSLMYDVSYNYSVPVLFEIVIEGKLSLLLRERIVAESVSNNYFPSYYSYSMLPRFQNNYSYVNKVKYDYFLLHLVLVEVVLVTTYNYLYLYTLNIHFDNILNHTYHNRCKY